MTDEEKLQAASEFDMGHIRYGCLRMPVLIRKCVGHRLPKPIMWKVQSSSNGAVLAKDGEWEYEPIPSSRDDAFYARFRFDSFENAEKALNLFERVR